MRMIRLAGLAGLLAIVSTPAYACMEEVLCYCNVSLSGTGWALGTEYLSSLDYWSSGLSLYPDGSCDPDGGIVLQSLEWAHGGYCGDVLPPCACSSTTADQVALDHGDDACEVDVVAGTTTCDSSIVVSHSGTQWVLKFDTQYTARIDVYAQTNNAMGWALHLADSPSNDGYGGDRAQADHDAEIYVRSANVDYYGASDAAGVFPDRQTTAATLTGDRVVHLGAELGPEGTDVTWQAYDGSSWAGTTWATTRGFSKQYTACASSTSAGRGTTCDWEDRALGYDDYVYVGVNRMVGNSSRTGSGVRKVLIVRRFSTTCGGSY